MNSTEIKFSKQPGIKNYEKYYYKSLKDIVLINMYRGTTFEIENHCINHNYFGNYKVCSTRTILFDSLMSLGMIRFKCLIKTS